MSRGFVKDGDREDVPVVTPRAYIPEGSTNYVTREGLDALIAEKARLCRERDEASGNENDVRVTRNFINATLKLLDERICSAVIPNEPDDKSVVAFGAYIALRMNGQKRKSLRIVGADQADASKGMISLFSPIAKALLGRRAGEFVETDLPGGTKEIEIVSVSYEKQELTGATPLKPLSPRISSDEKRRGAEPPENTLREKPQATLEPAADDQSAAPKPLSDNHFEILPVVNERGITIGHAPRWQCHDGSKLLHPVVHLHLFNSRGELYLQKRPSWKSVQPGKWDTAVGGHISFGERVEDALEREAAEELGINGFKHRLVKRYVFDSPIEKEYINLFITIYDGEVTPSAELEGGRFWGVDEIKENLGKGVFTPNFESEFKKFLLTTINNGISK